MIMNKKNKIPMQNQMKFDTKLTIKRLWQYFKVSKKYVILAIIFGIFSALFVGGSIYISGFIYNKYFYQQETFNFPIIAFCITSIMLMLTYILTSFSDFLVTIFITLVIERHVCFNMRKNIFNKIQTLPIYYLDSLNTLTQRSYLHPTALNSVQHILMFST